MREYTIDDVRRVGTVIRTVRHDHGLTQQQLAEQAGVSRGWLNKLEQGTDTADLATVFRVLSVLSLTFRLVETEPDRKQLAAQEALATILGEQR